MNEKLNEAFLTLESKRSSNMLINLTKIAFDNFKLIPHKESIMIKINQFFNDLNSNERNKDKVWNEEMWNDEIWKELHFLSLKLFLDYPKFATPILEFTKHFIKMLYKSNCQSFLESYSKYLELSSFLSNKIEFLYKNHIANNLFPIKITNQFANQNNLICLNDINSIHKICSYLCEVMIYMIDNQAPLIFDNCAAIWNNLNVYLKHGNSNLIQKSIEVIISLILKIDHSDQKMQFVKNKIFFLLSIEIYEKNTQNLRTVFVDDSLATLIEKFLSIIGKDFDSKFPNYVEIMKLNILQSNSIQLKVSIDFSFFITFFFLFCFLFYLIFFLFFLRKFFPNIYLLFWLKTKTLLM